MAWNWEFRLSWIQSEMMLSVSPNCIVRSSLEEMLEALQRRDESEMPRDVPPALPRRAVSRSRLPSAKRRLPVSSEADATGESSEFCMRKGEMRGQNKVWIFVESVDTLFGFVFALLRIEIHSLLLYEKKEGKTVWFRNQELIVIFMVNNFKKLELCLLCFKRCNIQKMFL